MAERNPPKSSASTTRRLDRVLQQKLRAFDIKQHGGELMAWSPVGREAIPLSHACEADDGLRKVVNAGLPKARLS